jgi:hypothetical protein
MCSGIFAGEIWLTNVWRGIRIVDITSIRRRKYFPLAISADVAALANTICPVWALTSLAPPLPCLT